MNNEFFYLLPYALGSIALAVIAAGFILLNPMAKSKRATVITGYFAGYFLFTCTTGLVFLFQSTFPLVVSVVLINACQLIALYCVKYGLLWRRGHTEHLIGNQDAKFHLVLFVVSQVLLASTLEPSQGWRVLNYSINSLAILIFCLPLINLNRTMVATTGEKYAKLSMALLMVTYAVTPSVFLFASSKGEYMVWLMLLHLIGVFAIFGGFQSLLNADAYGEQYQMSIRDTLTGIYNRRYFFQQVKEVAAMQQAESVNSVILADIDKFKEINEDFGHDIGDAVLTNFAHLLTDLTGNMGLVSRFAGEEFAILLRHQSLQAAIQFAEQLRHACQSIEVPTRKGPIKITASFGVAEIWDMPEIDQTIKLADSALLAAKSAGRNRVCAA